MKVISNVATGIPSRPVVRTLHFHGRGHGFDTCGEVWPGKKNAAASNAVSTVNVSVNF